MQSINNEIIVIDDNNNIRTYAWQGECHADIVVKYNGEICFSNLKERQIIYYGEQINLFYWGADNFVPNCIYDYSADYADIDANYYRPLKPFYELYNSDKWLALSKSGNKIILDGLMLMMDKSKQLFVVYNNKYVEYTAYKELLHYTTNGSIFNNQQF